MTAEPILEIDNLSISFFTRAGEIPAVMDFSCTVMPGEAMGIVGESGCGKSTTANAILRLIKPPGRIDGGRILLGDLDLLTLPPEALPRVRWTRISLVMQGAMNSLNPVMRVRDQIVDVIEAHTPSGRPTKASLDDRVRALLNAVGLPDRVMRLYPHELSGGMKQRVCIAMAMALEPEVIIADEPTSALDVVVQRVVAQTLIDVEEKLGASLLLIGHDMGLQAQLVHRLGVMYAGKLVEVGPVTGLFGAPRHPYTQLLTASIPSIAARQPIRGNPGLPPSLLDKPAGCPFHPRCPSAMDVCREVMPETREIEPGHVVACHLY
jgi:peptide/nickel transport system ATP-binding protein